MNPSFVIDCSVAVTWLFEEEATPETIAVLHRLDTESALVPSLWPLELVNVMGVAERQRRVTAHKSNKFLANVAKLLIEVDHDAASRAFDHILPLCRKHQLTSYDAAYLDLAVRRQLPLATIDEPLRKAAKKLGIKLLGK